MTEPSPEDFSRDQRGRFGKGNKGGPGAPRRSSEYRQAIQEAIPPAVAAGVVKVAATKALQGDMGAAKVFMSAMVGKAPAAQPEPTPIPITLPRMNTLEECRMAANEVIRGVADGVVSESAARTLSMTIGLCMRTLAPKAASPDPHPNHPPTHFTQAMVHANVLTFQRQGALPEDPHEAWATVVAIKNGIRVIDPANDDQPKNPPLDYVFEQRQASPLMDALLDEAIESTSFVGAVARFLLIQIHRNFGGHPPAALASICIPSGRSAAFFITDFPMPLAKHPFRAQTRRLQNRMRKQNDLVPSDPEGTRQWALRADEATAHFYKLGLLPSDPQMLEVALIAGELRATISYAAGEKVADLMRLYDVANRGDEERREAAIGKLLAMARAGRFLNLGASPALAQTKQTAAT